MLYIPKTGDYIKDLTDDKVKDFVSTTFSEYFKSTTKKLYSKLSKKQILRRVVESLCIFLRTHNEVKRYVEIIPSNSSDKYVHHFNIEIWNLSDQELQLIKNKPMIKNKLKELFNELKKFKVKKILFLEYKKRNY